MKTLGQFVVCLMLGVLHMNLYGQSVDPGKYNEEKQEILNLVINSRPFGGVCRDRQMYFQENELLSADTPIVLQRKRTRVVILEAGSLLKNKSYVVLGDFTTDVENMITARVQLEVMPQEKLLNFYVVKKNGKWIIHNHKVLKEK
jgi:hypothetical protein